MSQASKTLGLMAAFVLVAGGLGLYAYYGVYQHDEAETAKKDHDERLFTPQKLGEREPDGGTVKTDWTRLTVTTTDGTTVLTRAPGEEWRLVLPVRARADKLVVDGVTSQLQTAKFKVTLEEKPDEAALVKYGLKPPQFAVEAEAYVGEDKERRTLRLEGGIENTFDGSVYLRRGGQEPVYTAEGGVRWALSKSTFELRAKDVLAVAAEQVKSVAMKSKANDWLIERLPDKSWKVARPFVDVADGAAILSMLGALTQVQAQAFPADSPDARKGFGLDAPQVDATLTLESGKTVRVRIGKVPDGKFYALRTDDGGDELAEVGMGAPGALDRNAFDLRDRSLVSFKKELVTKAVFHGEGPEVVTQKAADDAGSDTWSVTAPRQGPAKVFKLTSALWTLSSLKSAKLGEEKPKSWAKYGIDEKSRWIALFGADGQELARITIGKPVPGNEQLLYARGARNQVVEIDGARFNELPFKVEDVLDVRDEHPRILDAGAPDPGR